MGRSSQTCPKNYGLSCYATWCVVASVRSGISVLRNTNHLLTWAMRISNRTWIWSGWRDGCACLGLGCTICWIRIRGSWVWGWRCISRWGWRRRGRGLRGRVLGRIWKGWSLRIGFISLFWSVSKVLLTRRKRPKIFWVLSRSTKQRRQSMLIQIRLFPFKCHKRPDEFNCTKHNRVSISHNWI